MSSYDLQRTKRCNPEEEHYMIRKLAATAVSVATMSLALGAAMPTAHAAEVDTAAVAEALNVSPQDILAIDTDVSGLTVVLAGCTVTYVKALLANPHNPIPTVSYLPLGTLSVNYTGTLNYSLYPIGPTITYVFCV